jgi:hypothetical protein
MMSAGALWQPDWTEDGIAKLAIGAGNVRLTMSALNCEFPT